MSGLTSDGREWSVDEDRMPMANTDARRVLVVDDERVIADTLAQIFVNAGYDALAVYSAEEALRLIGDFFWSPDLAILDVQLPGMNGIDLAIRLNAEYPTCRLTLFSGETATTELVERALGNGHRFNVLAKPIHPLELLGLASGPVPES
jgi:DNA-binding response OmpR family regulator